MKTNFSLLVVAACAAFSGCSKNPAENVPAASTSTATNAAAPAPVTAKVFTVAPGSSKVEFTGSKVTGKHDGGFHKFTGEINVVAGNIVGSGNKVVIDTTSIFTDTDRLTGHLKTPDFFDTAKYPEAIFITTAIEKGATNSTVTGNLTLHGVTKQITFPAMIEVTDSAVNLNAEFFLNRHDFEMKYAGQADNLIRPEVVLRLKVSATPKEG